MLESKLEQWEEVLERNGMKTSRSKTEFLEFRFRNEARSYGSGYGVRPNI